MNFPLLITRVCTTSTRPQVQFTVRKMWVERRHRNAVNKPKVQELISFRILVVVVPLAVKIVYFRFSSHDTLCNLMVVWCDFFQVLSTILNKMEKSSSLNVYQPYDANIFGLMVPIIMYYGSWSGLGCSEVLVLICRGGQFRPQISLIQ